MARSLKKQQDVVLFDQAWAETQELADRLHPDRNRAEVSGGLERLFRAGRVPDPWPDGPLDGRLLATFIWAPWDSVVTRLAGVWMPWMGKAFDPAASTGINRFRPTGATRRWLKMLFPAHGFVERGDRIEAFPFRNRLAPGALDPDVQVLKIDYDFDANPALIRKILDELVEVAPGRYLGKILMRVRGRYRRVGFFSLRSPES
jgi:hypothetical protein